MLSNKFRFLQVFLFTCIFTLISAHAAALPAKTIQQNKSTSFAKRKEVQQFIQSMHKKHGLNEKNLNAIFSEFGSENKVLRLMSKQYEALPWYRYRDTVITEKRIQEGVQFWREHKDLLKKAEAKFGVPSEIIVAILGIETSYGKITGNYPVLQALATLAFDYPRRAAFFRGELENFLLLVNEGSLDPVTTRGSFAGAIGTPQFMPSSYRRYAVDFSGTGKRDLIHDMADVIGSVGNYMKKNGWKKNEKIIATLRLQEKTHPLQKGKLIVLEKNAHHDKEEWIGLDNFNVILRYNRSTHYAMAVYQLSQKIRILKTRAKNND
ncbi:MAG TPA: lytic murein transglycosylase B [Gammaproteobacteria bacterium]|nr:lytic murein transglycosylase B [Gammaproteobacteria bacterium]HQZ87888.1 lytic murein transglycosylase B [Gammaproteobacteria bacterium]HRA43107.1 lytic murein transglycosylase B [Gammaproteobacteria bacterium]